jgi:hypothetical protein
VPGSISSASSAGLSWPDRPRGAAGELERAVRIERGQPAASERGAGRASRGRRIQIRLQRLAEQFGHGPSVGAPAEETRQRGHQRRPLRDRRDAQQRRQRLERLVRAIQRNQQLHLVAQRLGRLRQRDAPRLHRGKGLLAGARLQRDVGRAPEHLFVARPAGRLEHHLVGGTDFARAQLDLADHQLVEQGGVEAGIVDRRGRLGRGAVRQASDAAPATRARARPGE